MARVEARLTSSAGVVHTTVFAHRHGFPGVACRAEMMNAGRADNAEALGGSGGLNMLSRSKAKRRERSSGDVLVHPRSGPPRARAVEKRGQVKTWPEFVRFLKARGARVTLSRRFVFEGVLERRDHFQADELAAHLLTSSKRVSRGTVYRTLALMTEAGVVRKVPGGGLHVRYECVVGQMPHEHLVCERCGRFIEFTDPVIAERIRNVCARHRFSERAHRVTILGVCENCGGGMGSDT